MCLILPLPLGHTPAPTPPPFSSPYLSALLLPLPLGPTPPPTSWPFSSPYLSALLLPLPLGPTPPPKTCLRTLSCHLHKEAGSYTGQQGIYPRFGGGGWRGRGGGGGRHYMGENNIVYGAKAGVRVIKPCSTGKIF